MKILNVLLILFAFASCVQSTNKDTSTGTVDPLTPPPGDGGGDGGGDDGGGTGEQAIDYHKINSPYITMHGSQHYAAQPSRIGPNGEIIMWSSETDLQGISEGIFTTDSRFNMRLVPRNSGATIDSQGNSCDFHWLPFQKLQVEVRIRKKGSAYGYNHVFNDMTLDVASKVKEFTVPLNLTDPLVIEVLRVKWDYTCTYYENLGYPDYPGYCPWDDVWQNDCVALEMQVSTDYTKDIPGDRY